MAEAQLYKPRMLFIAHCKYLSDSPYKVNSAERRLQQDSM